MSAALLVLSLASAPIAAEPFEPVAFNLCSPEAGVGAAVGAGAGALGLGAAGALLGAVLAAGSNASAILYYGGYGALLGCVSGVPVGALLGAMTAPTATPAPPAEPPPVAAGEMPY